MCDWRFPPAAPSDSVLVMVHVGSFLWFQILVSIVRFQYFGFNVLVVSNSGFNRKVSVFWFQSVNINLVVSNSGFNRSVLIFWFQSLSINLGVHYTLNFVHPFDIFQDNFP